ncbi:zinc-dependent alcohol dehydrogenase family protein [Winogradskya consettensis]|uniref:Alcohol dehydrogenase n=1 Tax=Winogradskya consettensis TaxID=113560 RepID=A0A919SEB6_9ACTN|nr:zinc-dependent alcohol dehydrogenase family protein [Actinoplanes consettensis]GIM71085.1 alcohol dehydrogenase [Actinoplanes consettensis]
MRAVLYEQFGELPTLAEVADPAPPPGGVVVTVEATGVCRSDWHGWRGHDPDIRLPHVPGHEFAGVVAAVGAGVRDWHPGDRVTTPFICACGTCPACLAGDQQVCHRQQQPGFTHWGSFADQVVVHQADINLVRLPPAVAFAEAATLGCRFATSFRAVVTQGRTRPGTWLAVHGCGGVGLSAVMIAAASGARVIAVDVNPAALDLATRFGASVTINARTTPDVPAAIRDVTDGGAHVSLDALGSAVTMTASIESLRRRGRHVQVGLLPPAAGGRPAVPMELVVAHELEIVGSHGMPAHAYPSMMAMIEAGTLRPAELITHEIALPDAPAALAAMDGPAPAGFTVIKVR